MYVEMDPVVFERLIRERIDTMSHIGRNKNEFRFLEYPIILR